MVTPKSKQSSTSILSTMGKGSEPSPEMKQKVQAYTSLLMNLIHSKDTHKDVLQMLSAAPPEVSIPNAALTINGMAESILTKSGDKTDPNVLLASSQYLVTDLIELGNTAGMFKVDEAMAPQIYQATLQQYIQDGIKRGTIDPVQLQSDIDPLLSDEQKEAGLGVLEKQGMPTEPTQQMAIDRYVQSALSKNASKQRPSNSMLMEK